MRILMIGDVVGRPGRQAVAQHLPALMSQQQVDFVVCNAENAAAGVGITPEIARTLLEEVGIHVITLGNHAWARKEVYPYLNTEARVLRPFNYPSGTPGRGYGVYDTPAGRIGVIALQGRTFMEPVDDPFRAIDTILTEILPQTRIVLVDFHAEATSEKQAFAWYVDGRVSAVIGTHTHVQTADERILPSGTAYLTDVGMSGPIHSIIGMDRQAILARFTTLMPVRFEVAEGTAQVNGVLIDVDPQSGHAAAIQRVQIPALADLNERNTLTHADP